MARVEVEMPQMGESVMEGTVIEWTKKVGEQVEEDETLLEIATDKVDTEVPSPQAGTLVEILAEEGDTIEVGQTIAVIETDADDVNTSEGQKVEKSEGREVERSEVEKSEGQEVEPEPAAAPASGSADTGGEGERVEVKMPKMGESVMEGTVIEWTKKVGEQVEEDETLLEISTDKVDTEVPSPQAGTLLEILVEEGETIEVGQTIAVIATGKPATPVSGDGERTAAPAQDTGPSPAQPSEKQPAAPASAAASGSTASQTNGQPAGGGSEPQRIGSDGRFYSPLVRSIAREENISQEELERIEGSGKGDA